MNNKKTAKIRTVSVNERGQIVIPEDIRKDFGIENSSTLVLIERKGEIVLKKEEDVIEAVETEDKLWKSLSNQAMKTSWSKEDEVWDKIYKEGRK